MIFITFSEHIYHRVHGFPVGGQKFHLSNGKTIPVFPSCGIRAQDSEGQVWEYFGISAYEADNRERIKGWQKIYA